MKKNWKLFNAIHPVVGTNNNDGHTQLALFMLRHPEATYSQYHAKAHDLGITPMIEEKFIELGFAQPKEECVITPCTEHEFFGESV